MPWEPRDSVVVPVDFSSSSAPAVREALRTASGPSAVHVLHVVPKFEAGVTGFPWTQGGEDSGLANARLHLETFLASYGIEGVQSDILAGDPGMMIVQYANDCHADLIVIPTHGYHGLKHVLLGSVAERVIRHAHCPVYVLRRIDAV